jgi:hypothetical protein
VQLTIGGSNSWTAIKNIDNIIPGSGDFSITSDKINELIGYSGTVNKWTINMPALKNVVLTSPNYSGTLSLKHSNNNPNFPNLESINISNSKI